MSDLEQELTALHEQLQRVFNALVSLRERGLPDGLSAAAAFAIGEATGIVSKAKALVGRDIDGLAL